MKSRTSFFHKTVFKKDLTRFAPAWGAYLIVLLLALINLIDDGESYWRVNDLVYSLNAMVWVNLIYAGVVAQLLFGDLFQSRICNALHAMPVKRETQFGSHLAAALIFSAGPNLVVGLLALPLLNLGAGSSVIFWWFAASLLQYVFFLGIAVLCVMLSGNRLGQIAMYSMINFAALAAAWLASSIYEPLLYGIQIETEAFYRYCPVAELSQINDMLVVDVERIHDEFGHVVQYDLQGIFLGEGWGYMAICAGLGILALLGALRLYRERKLECAGDFVAYKAMEPAVQVLATVFVGGFFHLFGDMFGMNIKYVLIFCGMAVGYFACRMLLKRTARVFSKKAFLGCGAIMAAFALTLALTMWDIAGITRYIPEAEDVQSVTFSNSYSLYRHEDFPFTAVEQQDIEAILGVHADCVDRSALSFTGTPEKEYYTDMLRLEYKLKNGKTVNRFYDIHPMSEAGQVLKKYYTRAECVLGFPAEEARIYSGHVRHIYIEGVELSAHSLVKADFDSLLEAVIADCAAGNMAQDTSYHYPSNYDLIEGEFDPYVTALEISWDMDAIEGIDRGEGGYGLTRYCYVRVYSSCENTLHWLQERDLLSFSQKAEIAKYLGRVPVEIAVSE